MAGNGDGGPGDTAHGAALRARLAARARTRARTDAPRSEAPRLSRVQQEIWADCQREGRGGAYTTARFWRIRGPLDEAALASALAALVARHEALRMRIETRDGLPVPAFRETGSLDLAGEVAPDPAAAEAWLAGRIADLACRPIDLSGGPLHRFRLLRAGPDDVVLAALVHHIVCDDWSMVNLAADLSALYAAHAGAAAPPPPPDSYRAAMALSAARDPDTPGTAAPGLDWPVPQLPRRRAAAGPEAFHVHRLLPDALVNRIAERARAARLSLFDCLAAAMQVALSRFCDQQEVTLGAVYADRPSSASEAMIGMFVRHLALAARIDADAGLGQLAGEVAARMKAALSGAPASTGGGIEATAVYYNAPAAPLVLGAAGVEVLHPERRGLPVDMHLAVRNRGDRLSLRLHARAGLFEPPAVAALLDGLTRILAAFAADPGLPALRAPFARPRAQARALAAGQGPAAGAEATDIAGRFRAVARAHPHAAALVSGARQVSYATLDARSDALAGWLAGRGLEPGQAVGLALPRGEALTAATLGVLKAGAVVVPLDPGYPDGRLAAMTAVAACRLVLCADAATAARFADLPAAILPHAPAGAAGDAPPPPATDPDAPAYIVFTSGSTGPPKGVLTTHRAIIRLADGLREEPFGPGDRLAHLASPSFDGAFIEIWGALLSGAALALPEGPVTDARGIAAYLRDNAVNVGFLSSGIFDLLVDADVAVLGQFDWLATGGEAMSAAHARRALARHPDLPLYNVYGPTENGALSTAQRLRAPVPEAVPIGRPLPGNVAVVLGRDLAPVPAGFAGELCVGGAGLALGYAGQPELTAEKFVTPPLPWPEGGARQRAARLYRTGDRVVQASDGALQFLGRTDGQVKLSGFRIEPAEIEAALEADPRIAKAAVVPRRDPDTGRVIDLAAVVACADADADEAGLRAELAGRLPRFAMPARILRVAALPLTANGKLDRARLAEIAARRPQAAGEGGHRPAGPLAEIWAELLGRPVEDARASFFDLGGHSLLAMRMLARVEERLGTTVEVSRFLADPTLDTLARLAGRPARAAPGRSRRVALLRDGDPQRAPLVLAMGIGGACTWTRDIVAAWGDDRPIYGLQHGGIAMWEADPLSLDELADALIDDLPDWPAGTRLHLAGYSFGGFLVAVLAGRLARRGWRPGRVILLDPNANFANLGLGGLASTGEYPRDLLERLRLEHEFAPLECRIDFVGCRRAFPMPRLRDAEEWAHVTTAGVDQHLVDTYHTNLIHGPWARLTAALIGRLLGDDPPAPAARIPPRWDAGFMSDLQAARRLAMEGRHRAALAGFRRLRPRGRARPPWLVSAEAQLMAALGDRRGLAGLAVALHLKGGGDPLAWAALAANAWKIGAVRLAGHCWARAVARSGSEMTGAFNLVMNLARRGRLRAARSLAERMVAGPTSKVDGHLALAWLARDRGDAAECFAQLDAALNRSDVGLNHFTFAARHLLGARSPARALAVLDRGLALFREDPSLVAARREILAQARPAQAPPQSRTG